MLLTISLYFLFFLKFPCSLCDLSMIFSVSFFLKYEILTCLVTCSLHHQKFILLQMCYIPQAEKSPWIYFTKWDWEEVMVMTDFFKQKRVVIQNIWEGLIWAPPPPDFLFLWHLTLTNSEEKCGCYFVTGRTNHFV